MTVRILQGDCITVMATLPEASVDAIVTDPPYGIGFMGKAWDGVDIVKRLNQRRAAPSSDPQATPLGGHKSAASAAGLYDLSPAAMVAFQEFSAAWAREAFRVLKPGGHLLSFASTRTYHRMVSGVEDAGFEIRDQIGWVFGSGFPKSLDVSKAIDKAARGVPQGGADPTSANHGKFKGGCSADNPEGRGFGAGPGAFMAEAGEKVERELVAEAQQWQGWGTALKPAWEPIVLARKPLVGTVAANVLAHGTGALNIDGCRVHSDDSQGYAYTVQRMASGADQNKTGKTHQEGVEFQGHTKDGRWPANIIHDGSDEVLAAFPQAPGQQATASTSTSTRSSQNVYSDMARGSGGAAPRLDTGSAARFFYCAKADRADRNEGLDDPGPQFKKGSTLRDAENIGKARAGNHHPTVKPTDLMRYLCRLVTPPGGLVLDPFMGSGSTLKAAELEGFSAIGIELDPDYIAIARRRIAADAPLFSQVESDPTTTGAPTA